MVFLAGCGSILIKPAIYDVKKVALISVYMNRDFYDIKAVKDQEAKAALRTLGRGLLNQANVLDKLDNTFNKEYQEIVSYGATTFSRELDGVSNWQWVPMSQVVENKAYQNFVNDIAKGQGTGGSLIKLASTFKSADWFIAPRMIFVPIESVAQSGTHIYSGDAEDPKEGMKKALAGLCKKLGVDAVAILEFDMGYKKPGMSFKLIGVDPATPNISTALVMVTSKGEIAVNTGLVVKGQGNRFTGEKVGMLNKEYVTLNEKVVSSYCVALEKSAINMKEQIEKAYSKLK